MGKKVILLKEKDIERGLTILEYVDWCTLFNTTQIINIQSSAECCTKNEILEYSEHLNKEHHRIMNQKAYNKDNPKLLKCYSCSYGEISKCHVSCGGTQTYEVFCKKEGVCFEENFDASESDLPCYNETI